MIFADAIVETNFAACSFQPLSKKWFSYRIRFGQSTIGLKKPLIDWSRYVYIPTYCFVTLVIRPHLWRLYTYIVCTLVYSTEQDLSHKTWDSDCHDS
jgi:hypothetical protein